MVITNFVTKFGDKLVTKLGEHQIWCRIRWQIWWSKNSVRNMSLNKVNKLLTKFSQKFVLDFVINLVIAKFCDEYVTQFGVKFGDHHVWWQILWQNRHQIGGSPNMVPKWSPKLVTAKYVTKMFTKFGDKRPAFDPFWHDYIYWRVSVHPAGTGLVNVHFVILY